LKMGRWIAVFAALMLIAAICSAANAAASKKSTYLIGAVFDITGPGAPLGTPERDTVLMVQDQVNKSGGINGHPIKFIIYDNASDETKCALAVKKLISADKVKAIIGPSTTGTTLAVIPTCEKEKIPLISCAAGINITEPVKPFVFKTAQADTQAVAKVLDYLKSKKIKRVAFISVSNAFGKSGATQIDLQAPKAGITVLDKEEFSPTDTDMTSQLTRIKAAKPQAVICWGTNPGPAIVAKNMKAIDLNAQLIMSHGIANKKFIELAGDAANGIVFPAGRLTVASSIPSSSPQKKLLQSYSNQFNEAYGRDADGFGGYAFDAAQLVIQAMRKAGDNPAKIRAEIEKTHRYVGISGVFKFSASDHNGLTKDAFVLVQIKNGKWTLLPG
jgi:branched-chain amino acid transport system substrate-binding protein